jgi:antitoxin component YwqK of YwqJK toxin-antitoxin module
MRQLIFLLYFLLSFNAKAQYDTIIGHWKQGEKDMTKYYSFQKPTVLVFEFQGFYYTADGKRHLTEGKHYYHYSKGKANGPAYTKVDGQLVDTGSYKNGLKEGVFKTWQFPGGKLHEEKSYKNGELDGPSRWWSYQGWLASEAGYKNGKLISEATCYFSNGKKGMARVPGDSAGTDSVYYWYRSGEPMMYTFLGEVKYYKSFEHNFGSGVIIKEFKHIACPLYESPTDAAPIKNPGGSDLTLDACFDTHHQLYLDIGAIYLKDSIGWTQLIVRPQMEDGCVHPAFAKVWVKTECIAGFYIPWEIYLVGKQIRSAPGPYVAANDSSKICRFLPQHCLTVKKVVGDWVLVSAGDDGGDECNNTTPCEEEGWVRWKDGEKIIVELRKSPY